EPKVLAAKVWALEAISSQYQQVIDRLVSRFGIKETGKREEFLKKIYRDYLEALIVDPMLPPGLLPENWPRHKAAQYLLRAGVVKE
ncbi:MAG: PaaX family transcriptional regulator C-terminal domain-containing protein, partial [Candidatus Beckwithbacteria bacterium]